MASDDTQPEGPGILWGGITALLLGYSLWLRIVDLARVPGINGDEAWYGVQMQRVLVGDWVWRTPPGNPLNPFFSGMVLALEAAFGSNYWVLRTPAALAGLLCVVVAWWLMRRARDGDSAWLFALALVVLPTNLVYARLGWDPALVTLSALPLCYFVWQGRFGLAMVAGIVAVWVHPTSVFLAPLVAVCWLVQLFSEKDRRARLYLWLALATVMGLAGLALLLWLVPAARTVQLDAVAARLGNVTEWGLFVLRLAELFSGTTVYLYLVGEQPWRSIVAHDAVTWLVGIAAALGLWRSWRAGDHDSVPFVLGTAVALIVFYLSIGVRGVQPGTERYALWCVVPMCWCATLGLRAWLDWGPRTIRAFACVVALAALLSFQVFYMNAFAKHGGRSHHTFRTAQVEPKQAALDYIRAARSAGNTTVLAEDWWSYWPLAYLAANDPELRVVALPKGPEGHDVLQAALRKLAFLVGFAGGPIDRLVEEQGVARRVHTVRDPAGEPVLHVFRANGQLELCQRGAAVAPSGSCRGRSGSCTGSGIPPPRPDWRRKASICG